ncbi:C-type lectin domain family 3 member A-like [Erpetoichthys calabaricus]|uniref:C-type lectin domain family 3 member A-like n=1 Tax=Erpetoichthys calabaricus TaxID=27687 RepID=UPI002233F78C|nr:C-type lectin domain family 3 member A-like [Erpetoichthys calabaricus]
MKENFSKLNDKQQDLEEIKNAYYNLTSNYSTLLKTHAILQSQYTKNYSALVESQAALETQCLRNYSALQESRATLEIHWTRNHSALMKSHATLQSQCEILKKDHAELLAWNRKLKKCNNPVINMTRENVSCPEGWLLFDLKCYFFSTDIKTWQLSQEQCMSMGGHLVIIESMEEENFLEDKANILTGENYGYWIGLTDLEKEGQFVWVDSRPLDPKYRFWERTEPNGGQKENCVQMWLISQWKRWHDFPCVTEARRICEAIATLLPI